MQIENHIFQGMRRGNHQIKQDSKYLWNALNIRITNREDNTLFSISNEKGTSLPLLSFNGSYVGHCVLNKYLVVFTANNEESWIYRIEKKEEEFISIILFHGDLNLSSEHPIETLGMYETELIQKVYWIDDINSPRVINITKAELKKTKEELENILINGADLSSSTIGLYTKDSFNFIQSLSLKEVCAVNRIVSSGIFSPGTIQYAFTYYNKHESESNIFYVTPIHYIAYDDRGGSPEDKIACAFNIELSNLDNFDYVRIYSIHRTSIDAVPTVKLVTDVPVTDTHNIRYTDNGTTGSTVDPTYLLYVGGKDIIAKAMTQKSNTLFLGNIKLKQSTQIFKDTIRNYTLDAVKINTNDVPLGSSYYTYSNSLNRNYSAVFKTGETYRCGIQIQDNKGVWSEPIFLEDTVMSTIYPWNGIWTKQVSLNYDVVNNLISKGAKRIRTCVVFPRTFERERICQGVLCPTVYNTLGRSTNAPYASSSWFFRPAKSVNESYNITKGENIEFRHNMALIGDSHKGVEVQSMSERLISDSSTANVDIHKGYFFVDENLVTFHSPDVEFDTNIQNLDWEDTTLEIIGKANLSAISGDIDIQTSSPTILQDSVGFSKIPIGFSNETPINNGGLVSGLFYRDSLVNLKDYTTTGTPVNFMIYPWQRSGSLNNDVNRPIDKGTRSAVLEKKQISNLKFFDKNYSLNTNLRYSISTPKLFMSDQVSLLKVNLPFINEDVPYYGNVDTLITVENYPLLKGTNFKDSTPEYITKEEVSSQNTTGTNYEVSDPIRMKYKSTPHLVFALNNYISNIPEGNNIPITLLPRIGNVSANNSTYEIPYTWFISGNTSIKGLYDGDICVYNENKDASMVYTPEVLHDSYDVFINSLGKYSIGKIGNTYPFASITILKEVESIILRAVSGKTYIKENQLLPNTTEEDYSQNCYIGKDRFYKFTYDSLSISYNIEDITDTIGTNAAARKYQLNQEIINPQAQASPYLLLAEIVRKVPREIKFGGTTEEALRNNLWLPASDSVILETDKPVNVLYQYGDSWYQRYDCLKTYAFTKEDENQIVEIGSFMCESRVNIDGRYDRNRGEYSNLTMSPINFNLINEVYSQKNNFFNYRILDEEFYKQDTFTNQILWSKQKTLGEEIDTWTNITLANTLDLNGDKGQITALETFNNDLLCFQEKAINQISFDDRVQIPVSDGVPIEISNGTKVSGYAAISSSVGCQDKWTISNTSSGIYFVDYNTDSMWLYDSKNLSNLGMSKGMNWWIRQGVNNIKTFYDNKYGDVYFTPKDTEALCYSTELGEFVSFLSYNGVEAMFNLNNDFYSLKSVGGILKLYQNNVGKYNDFFGENKEWNLSFISNDNPTYTKIFDTVELRTDHYSNYGSLLNSCPINFIAASNEYQKSFSSVNNINMRKKFRVWRGLIPRNTGTRQRIRNPWTMITLGKRIDGFSDNNKAIIHDIAVKYTV